MITDISEKGLETLIMRHLTGVDGLAVSPELVASLSYYVKEKPIFDWQFLFVIGIFLISPPT